MLKEKPLYNFRVGWYVVYTLPRHEKRLGYELERKGVEYLIATFTVEKRWHDRVKVVDQMLFPSYVFIKLNDLKDFHEVSSSSGFCYFVKDCKQPAIIREEIITSLQILNKNKSRLSISTDHFLPGIELIVTSGVMKGFKGEVVRSDGKERVLIRIDVLNSNILFDLPANSVMSNAVLSNAF